MNKDGSKDIAKGHLKVPSHDPLPGVDEQPIDVGAATGAQLPDKTGIGKPGRQSREVADRGIPVNPDPDDPVSP